VGQARVVAGRYELIRPLGRGGMGAVWLGDDALAGRQVAVKELRAPDGASAEERGVFRQRALHEARSAARLSHPNAVTLHDIIPATADDDAVYLIMEYVDGATLAQLAEREGRLSEPRVTAIALQLLAILEASHALGIVHRDIKPANIMVTAAGQVKLADFGIAHTVGGTRLTGSGVVGTPAYMAPEQLQGLAITPAVDRWALGVTLYTAVAGRNPFERDNPAATFHAILMAELPGPACGPPLAPVIAAMLVRDPEQRMTIAQARQLLAGATAWSGVQAGAGQATGTVPHWPAGTGASSGGPSSGGPAVGGLPADWLAAGRPAANGPGDNGPATRPGSPAHPDGQDRMATLAAARPGLPLPGSRRRPALIAGTAVAIAAVAAAVLAVTIAHHGGSGAAAAGDSPAAASSTAPSSTAASSTGTGPAGTGPAAPGASAVPPAYLGHWKGTLADNTGLEGPQAADLTITGGAVNSVVGTVSYPNVGCTYDFRLVSAQPGQVTFYEQVRSGLCESEYVVLAPADGGITENVYPGPPSGVRPDFSGPLARAS
jgi:hypothetical protein